jgi:hypothetical protein
MMIDKEIEAISNAAATGRETTLSAAEVITLFLMVGFGVIGGGALLLMLAII